MILIGQFDSPYTRRVGIALELYGLPYQHRPWSTFGDPEKIAAYNPLLRVPTLVLDDGEVLIETLAILDAVDEMAAPGQRLVAAAGAPRRKTLQIAAFAGGVSDKVVMAYYSAKFHASADASFVARIDGQIRATLDWLERDRAKAPGNWWLGAKMTHADIAVAATIRHFRETIGADWDFSPWPALERHAARSEALDVFKKVFQPFKFGGDKT